MTETTTGWRSITTAVAKDFAELFGKAAIGLLGIGYVAGLLIINFHLSQYGLSSFGLVRTEHIAAGLLWLATSSVGWGFLRVLWWAWRRVARQWRSNSIGSAIGTLFTGVMSAGGLLTFSLSVFSGGTLTGSSPAAELATAGVVVLQSIAALLLYQAFRRAWTQRGQEHSNAAELPHSMIPLSALGVVVALLLYARFAYIRFLPVYGGGRAEKAILVLNDAGRAALAAQHVENAPVYLITEADDWVLITTASPSTAFFDTKDAIRIRRAYVVAIRSVASSPNAHSSG